MTDDKSPDVLTALDCPFCGSSDLRLVTIGPGSQLVWVQCDGCSCRGPSAFTEKDIGKGLACSEDVNAVCIEATNLWNARPGVPGDDQ